MVEPALHRFVRELHVRAGKPSSRTIAAAINKNCTRPVSHSAVNKFVQGKNVPNLGLVLNIVDAISGGDPEVNRRAEEMWVAAHGVGPKEEEKSAITLLQEEVCELRRLLEGYLDHVTFHKSYDDDGCRYCS